MRPVLGPLLRSTCFHFETSLRALHASSSLLSVDAPGASRLRRHETNGCWFAHRTVVVGDCGRTFCAVTMCCTYKSMSGNNICIGHVDADNVCVARFPSHERQVASEEVTKHSTSVASVLSALQMEMCRAFLCVRSSFRASIDS